MSESQPSSLGIKTSGQRIRQPSIDADRLMLLTASVIRHVQDVDWGKIDYLVVDAPPGTSDEHISIAQYLKASHVDGAVIVTTPQEVSLLDVRKEINFCKKVNPFQPLSSCFLQMVRHYNIQA